MKKKEDELKLFLEFLSESNPKTAEEINKEFGKIKTRKLFQMARAMGYESKRLAGKKIYLKESTPFNIEAVIKERNKTFASSEAYGKDGKFFAPGRLIIFSSKSWEKIRIVPIADLYWGSPLCDRERLKKYLEWIRRDEHVFTCLIGNIFSDKLSSDELKVKKRELEKILGPIFPKILFTVSGPNERRLLESKRVQEDPLAQIFEGKITHFLDQAYVVIKFEGQEKIMKLFAIHGESNAIVTGAKVNPIYNMLAFADADVMIMGNMKYSHVEKPQVISFKADGKGLDIQKVYLVLLPSFKSYWGSREASKGYPAQFTGQINIAFYRSSGDIHAYTGMLKDKEEVM